MRHIYHPKYFVTVCFWAVVKQQLGYTFIAAIDKYDAGVECTEIRSLQSALLEDVRS
jgi:hypothetical protein